MTEPAAFTAVEGPPLAAAACRWCGTALAGGEKAAVCNACGGAHHARCWNGHGGCRLATCRNAPLERILPRAARRACVHCGRSMARTAAACAGCRKHQTRDGRPSGPRRWAGSSVSALVFGVLAWIPLLGLFTGCLAILAANKALGAVRDDPGLRGRWLAVAGLAFAIPALLLHGFLFLLAMLG